MLYLNKLLFKIKECPTLFKTQDVILSMGLNSSNIKGLKKFAIEKEFIKQDKNGCFLTAKGEEYLLKNPLKTWEAKEFPLRSDVNVEYLKEDKIVSVLTKAMRIYAKYLIDNQPLKENSLEYAIAEDVEKCRKLYTSIEYYILNGKRNNLGEMFQIYLSKGLTKSIIAVVFLKVLSENLDKIAIYEKAQFQLKFDTLMFDRMVACPENFELQKTIMDDIYILKDISKIILNKKSENILEITKGLYEIFKKLDKYTLSTQNLDKKTLRMRNIILNAKDPISLFKRDIPKVLVGKSLDDCEREFLNNFKKSFEELKDCVDNLIIDLKKVVYETFCTNSKESLAERFLAIKEYLNNDDLKILFNSIVETNVSEEIWINRIATFVNKQRVPKDWNDNDYADFKIKIKELANKFFAIESVVGLNDSFATKNYYSVLNKYLKLTKAEQVLLLKKIANL